jgi:ABC-type glycerol-3-phosphate transport system permease component
MNLGLRTTTVRRRRAATARVTSRRLHTTTVLAYLVLIVVCIFNLLPFVFMLSTSLKTEKETYTIPPTFWPNQITIDAYTQIRSEEHTSELQSP